MFRLIKYLCLLVVIVAAFSCAEKAEDEIRSFSEYEEVSIDKYDMLVRGNCMPIELEGVSIKSIIPVNIGGVADMVFMTPNEIACVSRAGKVFICYIDSESIVQIADFREELSSWQLHPHNQNELLLVGREILQDRSGEIYHVAFMNKEGRIFWQNDQLSLPSKTVSPGPVYFGGEYVFMDSDEDENNSLYRLNYGGSLEIAYADFGKGRILFPAPYENCIAWIGNFSGPYYIEKNESGYSNLTNWNIGWDAGLRSCIDENGRMIGIQSEYTLDGEVGSLIILEKDGADSLVVNFDDDLDLDIFHFGSDWQSNHHCASNGEKIVFTATHYVLSYTENGLAIWHNNLEDYGDNWTTSTQMYMHEGGNDISIEIRDVLEIRSFYMDHDCENFIMILRKAILYGGDELEVIDFEEGLGRNIHFTPDFQRACVALENGSIVVLDLETSDPEDVE